MVFLPWSDTDIKEAMSHLAHLRDSDKRFADELKTFCQELSPALPELRRLLVLKLGGAEWAKLADTGPTMKIKTTG